MPVWALNFYLTIFLYHCFMWVHRLTRVNEIERAAVCANCGPVRVTRKRRVIVALRRRTSTLYDASMGWRSVVNLPAVKCVTQMDVLYLTMTIRRVYSVVGCVMVVMLH